MIKIIGFNKYVEVYSTLEMEDFFKAKNILSENGIGFKDISINNQLRTSFNNVRGDSIVLSRDGTVKTLYRLAVRKDSEEKSHRLLRSIRR